MKKYSVEDTQDSNYMDYTWAEPVSAIELRTKFYYEWKCDSNWEYKYSEVTLKVIQDLMEIRLVEFGTSEWTKLN